MQHYIVWIQATVSNYVVDDDDGDDDHDEIGNMHIFAFSDIFMHYVDVCCWFGLGYRKWTHDHVWYHQPIYCDTDCRPLPAAIDTVFFCTAALSTALGIVHTCYTALLEI